MFGPRAQCAAEVWSPIRRCGYAGFRKHFERPPSLTRLELSHVIPNDEPLVYKSQIKPDISGPERSLGTRSPYKSPTLCFRYV